MGLDHDRVDKVPSFADRLQLLGELRVLRIALGGLSPNVCAAVEVAVNGIMQYVKEVKEGTFPDDDHSYTVNEAEYEKFAALVTKRRQI